METVKITAISDLHGEEPVLPGGDLLIVAGDCTAIDNFVQFMDFFRWLNKQKYTHKILVAGNHDNMLYTMFPKGEKESQELNEIQQFLSDVKEMEEPFFHYLCDSGIELTIEGKLCRIWGSPWTKSFVNMNPRCKAFVMDTEEELLEKWKLIPTDTDILITHGPPKGILDGVHKIKFSGRSKEPEHCGSVSLRNEVLLRIRPRLHLFGHIHEWGGQIVDIGPTRFINCSVLDAIYDPVQPIVSLDI